METHGNLNNRADYLNGEMKLVQLKTNTTREEDERETPVQRYVSSCIASCKGTRHKLRTDQRFQEIFVYTICLYVGKFIQGWCQALFGPSYIDIRMISGTDLAQGSWILTSRFIGSAIGSTIQGALYGRSNNKLTFGLTLCGNCIVLALIPWCALFEAMICAHIALGIMHGIYASGISVEVIRSWRKDSLVALLVTQLMLTFGSALAPLAFTPFLIESETTDIFNTSSITIFQTEENFTDAYALHNVQSIIYIPFTITAGMSTLSGMFFVVLYMKYDKRHARQGREKPTTTREDRKVPKPLKLFVISMFGLLLFILAGVNEAFSGFLATYCIQYFHWTKKDGALVTFHFFLLNLISQIIGIAVAKWINTIAYTVAHLILMFLAVLGILISSLYNLDSFVWFFVPLLGFSKGPLFSMIFSWTNDYILPMTGRISGFYYICLMTGGAVNPILFGYVMEDIELIWFCYVLLIECIAMLIFIAVIVVTTRYAVSHFGRPLCKSQTITEEETFNED